jgi:hypothetical protein
MPRRPKDVPPEHHLDFGTICDEFDDLLESVRNKLEREWPSSVGSEDSAYIVWAQVRVSFVTFKALRYLCAEKPTDFNRKPEFVLAAPPLARAMADALANLIYLFCDLPRRTSQYLQGGWREDHELSEREKRRFRDDPEAAKYLDTLARRVDQVRLAVGIADGVEPRKVNFWPIPSQMKADTSLSTERREYLQLIEDKFYKDLSSASHLSGPGIYERSSLLLKPHHRLTDDDMEELAGHRSILMARAMALALCIASEVEIEVRLGLDRRLIRMWTRINAYVPDFKEIYDCWYASRLPPPVTS